MPPIQPVSGETSSPLDVEQGAAEGPKKEDRFKLSRPKILKLLTPLLVCHVILVILPAISAVPGFVISILQVGFSVYNISFIFGVLEAFSSSWASEFEHVEGERDHALFVNKELSMELMQNANDMDNEVNRMRESVGETRKEVKAMEAVDPEELMRKVVKLDEKVAAAAEARESRHLVALVAMQGYAALRLKYLLAYEAMEMIKRMSICKCTLTEEQLKDMKIHMDPRALRIICHNFTTFARTHEDSSSQYRAFATVDFEVPAHLSDVEKWSKVEVKVKYMGQPLCDEEIEKAENHAARMTSSKKIDEKDHVAQGESGSLTPNSLTPTTTFNTKMIWKDMEDGKNLALAYNMASMLGGSIKIVREFRFTSIVFEMRCKAISADAKTPERSPVASTHTTIAYSSEKTNSRKNTPTGKGARVLPSEVSKVAIYNSNNIQELIAQFPPNLKMISLTEDPKDVLQLYSDLGVNLEASRALHISPENIDIFAEIATGTVEIDTNDHSRMRRLKTLEAKMADIIIIGDKLGGDSSGRKWLPASLAATLDVKGYKGVVCVRLQGGDSGKIKALKASPAIHTVMRKNDSIGRVKCNIVLSLANLDENDHPVKKKTTSNFKRNNSFQRPTNNKDDKNDEIRIQAKTHRLSESKRRKSVDFTSSGGTPLAEAGKSPGLPIV